MDNVDDDEVNKFSALAASWWDKNSEFKPLHDINPLRLNYIKQQCGGSIKGKKILDIGCGGGILSESMAYEGADVSAIDVSDAAIEVAKLHLLESGLKVNYQKITAAELANKTPAKFDIITCLEMLEHVPEPSAIVANCAQLIKPLGQIFFSTINRNIKSYLFAIIGAEYILKLLPQGTHNYDKFIKPSELDSFARKAKLHLKDMKGMSYNPLSKIYKLTSDINVNYLSHYQNNEA